MARFIRESDLCIEKYKKSFIAYCKHLTSCDDNEAESIFEKMISFIDHNNVPYYEDAVEYYLKSTRNPCIVNESSDKTLSVGTWVRAKSFASQYECGVIEMIDEDGFVVNDCLLYEENLELWLPQEDEWCCFGDNKKNDSFNEGGFIIGKFGKIDVINGRFLNKSNNFYYDYCEPFNGNFPTFIR